MNQTEARRMPLAALLKSLRRLAQSLHTLISAELSWRDFNSAELFLTVGDELVLTTVLTTTQANTSEHRRQAIA